MHLYSYFEAQKLRDMERDALLGIANDDLVEQIRAALATSQAGGESHLSEDE